MPTFGSACADVQQAKPGGRQPAAGLLPLCTRDISSWLPLSSGCLVLLLQAWLVLAAWLLVAVRRPGFYRQHRTFLVMVFKTLLALAVLHLTNDGGRLISLSRDHPSSAILLLQATSLHGLVHLPALCVGLPLPLWLQLGWVLARTAVFCLGRGSRGEAGGVVERACVCVQERAFTCREGFFCHNKVLSLLRAALM